MNLNWQLLTPEALEDISEAREQCHQAIQNVAAVGRSFLDHKEDDSQANLEWDINLQRLVGRWVETEKLTFRSSFSINDFKVYLVSHNLETLASLALHNVKQTDVMIWLEHNLKELGLDFSKINLELPYKIPEYSPSKGKPFQVTNQKAFHELALIYHNANLILKDIIADYPESSKIRVWPHHFDQAGSIIKLNTGDTSTSKSISIGMSPGDKYYNEPYFYVTSWPYITEAPIKINETSAQWHEDDWAGLILTLSHITKFDLIQDQRGVVQRFFKESLLFFEEHLH
ncbi:hypothetical protein [Reichenbachiella versicolor]|uniref:hypothetical protein n=1 Tax=Reichenbachiella versicolor TaxID=1821036 RepID=UPI000D6E5F83|nr:hypothetical protein [Reichenbachiella versicolor]